MEIIVPLQVKVCLPEDEVVPIENLVNMLRDLKIGYCPNQTYLTDACKNMLQVIF